jgi:hypothetical protein
VLRPSRSSFHTTTVALADVLHQRGKTGPVVTCPGHGVRERLRHARRLKGCVLLIQCLRHGADPRVPDAGSSATGSPCIAAHLTHILRPLTSSEEASNSLAARIAGGCKSAPPVGGHAVVGRRYHPAPVQNLFRWWRTTRISNDELRVVAEIGGAL